MCMLASVGIFAETKDEEEKKEGNDSNKRKFEMTSNAAFLQSEAKESIRNFALMFGLEPSNRAMNDLSYSIETGENSFKHANGLDIFLSIFNRIKIERMLKYSIMQWHQLHHHIFRQLYDFSQFNTVIHIGGGQDISSREYSWYII